MRNLKKFLALVLAMMMALSLMVTVNAADPAKPTDFADLSDGNATYTEAINVLSALGVLKGYEREGGANDFMPKGEITRAEVAAMVYRIAHNDAKEAQAGIYKDYGRFADVTSDKWYAGVVNYCANAEIVKGVSETRFAPSSKVTGYQTLAMVLRMIGYGQNGEFEGSGWEIRTASYARKAGLTKNLKEGTLGQPASREVVAEILFQALQAPTVDYNLLNNYYNNDVLIADNTTNRTSYANAIAEGLTLPKYGNMMYRNYGIVGKKAGNPDAFGRPTVAWVKDNNGDTVTGSGNAGKYIVNVDKPTIATWDTSDIGQGAEDEVLSIALTPVKVYSDAIDECHLTKDINSDKSIFWTAITEIVNGEVLKTRAGVVKMDALHTSTDFIGATGRTTEIYKLDAKLYVDKDSGAVAADQTDPAATDIAVDTWIFVYIDTFLGEVTGVTEEVKDSAGHTIVEPTATVEVGNKIADTTGTAAGTDNPAKLTVKNPNSKFKRGDLVLVQTPNGGNWGTNALKASANTAAAGTGFVQGTAGPNKVDNPEKAPRYPTDVPNTVAHFVGNESNIMAQLLSTGATKVEGVTINATVGQQDAKMGIIATDGKTYMASNTFLAARQTPGAGGGTSVNNTVLAKWYDVPNSTGTNANSSDADKAQLNRGIVNAMIGRTYDLILDQNGYIIGMKEVVTVNDGVGIITSIDTVRAGGGKYVTEVEAFMTDGSTKTFQLLGNKNGKGSLTDTGNKVLDTYTDGDYGYFESMSEADKAWGVGGIYEKPDTTNTSTVMNVGSLVQFKSLSYDGKTFYKIVDWDHSTGTAPTTSTTATGLADTDNAVNTGFTDTLTAPNTRKLDSKSVIFVAEYEYRYNTSGNNDGSNINKTYKVYEGFKNMPAIRGTNSNILWQQLGQQTGNEKYVLVYSAEITGEEYIIRAQEKITVDDSYLVLSRGATYAEYSEYNVLKNGEQTTLKVSNANKALNSLIESTMDKNVNDIGGNNHLNELLLVTGTNINGYVTSVSTVKTEADAGAAGSTAKKNVNSRTDGEIIKAYTVALTAAGNKVSYKNDVLTERDNITNRSTETDGTVKYLTLDDNVKVQLVNRDMKTVTEISLDVAMVYANGSSTMTAKDMVFELNEYGYVCNLYVME